MSDSKRTEYIRFCVMLSALAGACLMAACRSRSAPPAPTVSSDTWAVVDGRAITRLDVDKTYRRTRDTSQTPSDEEALIAKLGVLDDLILQDILFAKARELKLEVPANELDAAFADARKNISDEAFQQELTKRKVTPDDMREGLGHDLLEQKILAQEVGSKVAITDQEIGDFFSANRAQRS